MNFNETFRKNITYDNIKSNKKSGLYPSPTNLSRDKSILYASEDWKIDSPPYMKALGNFFIFLDIADKLDRAFFLISQFPKKSLMQKACPNSRSQYSNRMKLEL